MSSRIYSEDEPYPPSLTRSSTNFFSVEQELEAHCRRERVSKSEVVNRLLKSFLRQQRKGLSFYDLGNDLGFFGCMITER